MINVINIAGHMIFCKRVLYYRKVNISEFTVSLNYLITMKTLLVRSSPFQANNHKQNITKQNI